MALVGPITIQGSTSSNIWLFRTIVTETATNIGTKESTVKVEHQLATSASYGFFAGTYTITYTAGGQSYTETIYKNSGNLAPYQYATMGSHTFTIKQTTTPLTITVGGSFSTSAFTPNSGSSSGSVTLSKLHEAPVLSEVQWVEQNPLLVGANLQADYFVPYLSRKKATVSALLYDDATIKETRIINEDNIYKSATSTPNVVEIDLTKNTLYTFYYEPTKTVVPKLSIGFTDSTDATSEWAYPYTYFIPYEKPSLKPTASSVKRNGQITGKAKLNLTGTFYNGKIGTVDNNVTLSFKYWRSGTTEPTTYHVIPQKETVNGYESEVYRFDGNNIIMYMPWEVKIDGEEITDLDRSYTYKFKIKVEDSFGSIDEMELTCPKGDWLRAIFKDRIDFSRITKNGVDVATIEDIRKNIIQVRINSDPTLSWSAWTDVEVPLDEYTQVGNKLTFVNNRIKIGSGVSVVRITGNVRIDITASDGQISSKIIVFTPNGDGTYERDYPITSYFTKSSGYDFTAIVPEHIISVKEGDEIGLFFQTGQANTNKTLKTGTSLIVEVIE